MQKTAKKFLAMLLAVVLALSMLPTAVFATESSDSGLMSIVPYGANDQTTGTATITAQDPVTFTGYATFEDVSHYHVTVPVGTTYVKSYLQGCCLCRPTLLPVRYPAIMPIFLNGLAAVCR